MSGTVVASVPGGVNVAGHGFRSYSEVAYSPRGTPLGLNTNRRPRASASIPRADASGGVSPPGRGSRDVAYLVAAWVRVAVASRLLRVIRCVRRVTGRSVMTRDRGECEMDSDQISANYEVYVAKYQDTLEREHMGKVALMHDSELVEVHDNYDNAYWHGVDDYGLGNFSIQEVGARPAQLGALTFAMR